MWHGDPGWGSWAVMTLGMVAFWALVVWAIMLLARREDRRDVESPRPEDILAARFARGEVDEQTYRRTIELLHAQPEERAGGANGEKVGRTRSD